MNRLLAKVGIDATDGEWNAPMRTGMREFDYAVDDVPGVTVREYDLKICVTPVATPGTEDNPIR